jgi:hypothetical protein
MDELAGVKGTENIARQAQFLAWRDAVESIASDLFDTGPVYKGQIVRIFAKHVPKMSPASADTIVTSPDPDAEQSTSLRVIAETRPANPAP